VLPCHGSTSVYSVNYIITILSSLKNGPLREQIEAQGGLKLIYIDPPFDVGADFSMEIEIGDETFTKRPGILEEIAYRDTWGKGTDSFMSMLYERLILMQQLLHDEGSLYIHIGSKLVTWCEAQRRIFLALRIAVPRSYGSAPQLMPT
jgi:hypothetical protein